MSDTQDPLNILTGILENEQDGEQVVLRDEERFSGEGLTDDAWNNHLLLEELIGSMLTTRVRVFSNSVFCTGPGALDPTSAFFWEGKQNMS